MRNVNPAVVQGTPCMLLRRFAAMFYDSLLLLSLWFFATLILLPFSSGEAIGSDNLVYPLYLYSIGYLYFAWQWIHGGQTLGMRAWHIKLVADNQATVTWRNTLSRYLLATLSFLVFGMGYFLALQDGKRMTLHDRYSRTYLLKT